VFYLDHDCNAGGDRFEIKDAHWHYYKDQKIKENDNIYEI
jgi:hypothetical protein